MSIDYLANLNSHPRDENITFQDEGHVYTVKHAGNLEGDAGFTSVTTLINTLFKGFDSDKIIRNMMSSRNWTKSKYYGMSHDEIKKLWSDNGTAAANAGTALHANIEEHYNGMNVKNDSIEYNHFRKFKDDFAHLTPYRTEWTIYHEDIHLAGSIDMVFQDTDGSLSIYDWKRVAEISKINKFNEWSIGNIISVPDSKYWHYAIQLNIYKAILIEKYNLHITDLYLVSLHPDNLTYNRIFVTDMQDEVRMLFDKLKGGISPFEPPSKGDIPF